VRYNIGSMDEEENNQVTPQNLPGSTFVPGQNQTQPEAQPPATVAAPVQPQPVAPTPQSVPEQAAPESQPVQTPVQIAPETPQQMPVPQTQPPVPESVSLTPQTQTLQSEDGLVVWEASEHVDYNNSGGWMALMILGGVILAGGIYILVDILSAIVVLMLLGGLLFYSRLKPKVLRYGVSEEGILVGDRSYDYSEFRSFSFNEEDGINSIFLVPMQRFMVPITMYVAPDNQDQIAEVLSQHLPNEQRSPDFMDRLTAKLRL